jgi:hypothetical protein
MNTICPSDIVIAKLIERERRMEAKRKAKEAAKDTMPVTVKIEENQV